MHSDFTSLTSRRNARRAVPPTVAAKPAPCRAAKRCSEKTLRRTGDGLDSCHRTAPYWAAPLARLVSAGAAFAVLAACTELKQHNAELSAKRKEAENLLAIAGSPAAGPGFTASRPAPGDSIQDTSNRHRLPAELRTAGSINYVAAESVNLADALAKLTDLTGITHLILAGADEKPIAALSGEMEGAVRGSAAGLDAAGLGQMFRPEFNDSLPGILDSLASRFGLEWTYRQGNVVFRQFVTRRYQIAALPSQTEYSSSIGNSNSSGSIDWSAEIKSSLAAIAGSDAVMSYGEGSGFLTVTARPAAQRKIADYVIELNGFLGDQVAIDINVLTVAHKQSEKYGFDVDLFIGEDGKDHIAWTGPRALTGGAGAVNVGIVSGNVDLSILLSALSREGDVTVETRTGATTSNNQIVPIQVVNTTAYAKSVESAAGADGRLGTTINPGTLTTGFEMQLLPRILAGGDILLRYSIKLSDLNDLAEFTSDRQTIQLPKLSTTSFEQQAILGDSETLVLMGFERDRHAHDRPGDSPFALLFGGQSGADSERISTVLTIRPRIVRSDGHGRTAGAQGK